MNLQNNYDPDNFGLHITDSLNVPDDRGRVVINIGHSTEKPDIFLAPQITKVIKPYQIGGIRFLYERIVRKYDTAEGGGCVLAHAMGLGKTLQIVCFSDIFLKLEHMKTILCIAPVNTIENWKSEFNHWLPNDDTLQSCNEIKPRDFNVYTITDAKRSIDRSKLIMEWSHMGGVLLIGYELFRTLTLKKFTKKSKQNLAEQDLKDSVMKEHLLDDIQKVLLNPERVVPIRYNVLIENKFCTRYNIRYSKKRVVPIRYNVLIENKFCTSYNTRDSKKRVVPIRYKVSYRK